MKILLWVRKLRKQQEQGVGGGEINKRTTTELKELEDNSRK